MKHFFAIVVSSALVFSSCHFMNKEKVKGNGVIKTEARTAANFSSIDVSGNMDIYLKQDSVYSVRVEADENLMQYIKVFTDGDKLVIEPEDDKNLSGSKDIKIYVSGPSFKKIEASGACDIAGETKIISTEKVEIELAGSSDVKLDINAPFVETESSGSGTIQLKGQTKDFSASGSGSTAVNSMELLAENVSIDFSGSGDAEVFASVKLDVSVSGSGHVKYKGNPAVSKSISGSGSVTKVE